MALWPPPAVRAAIAAAAAAVLPAGCRAVPAANHHLTLQFLGGIAADRLPALAALVESVPVEPFTLELDRTGAFDKARVAWLAPATAPRALIELHARYADALRDAGFELERRAYRPHVTLARRCAGSPAGWRGAPIAWYVDHAVLCRSEGTDAGVRYAVVARTHAASVR